MPGLENQEWWVKEFFIPGGTLPTHLVAPKKWTCHMCRKIYNLDRYFFYIILLYYPIFLILHCIFPEVVTFPDPTPTRGKGSGVLQTISWASRMQNSHVILIIVMATHCLVCGSRMQQHCGLICAAGVLSHEKSHAVNLIGAPEIRTATSSSPRNRSKYTRPSSPCRGGVWDRDYS